MTVDNSNMNSPIVIYPTACRRRGRARLCCNVRSPPSMAGGTFGGFCVYCGYGPGTSRLVAGALSRLQSAAPALTQRAKALAGAPEPARVERSCQRDQRLSAPANPLSRSRPDPIRRSESRQNALEAIRSKSRRASMRKFRCGTRKSRPIQNKLGATTRTTGLQKI
jgi:hypothetical protein